MPLRQQARLALGEQTQILKFTSQGEHSEPTNFIVATNSRQLIAFLMDSKLNIALHDAPAF